MSVLQFLGILAGQAFIAFLWYWTGYGHAQRDQREQAERMDYLQRIRRVSA